MGWGLTVEQREQRAEQKRIRKQEKEDEKYKKRKEQRMKEMEMDIKRGEERRREAMRKTFNYKIILIGNQNVGKTTLIRKFTDPKEQKEYDSEQAKHQAVFVTTHSLKIDVDTVKFEIWDTAGQEELQPLGSTYYHGSHAWLVLFDQNNLRSFQAVDDWIGKFLESADYDNNSHADDASSPLPIFLVWNKTDLERDEDITDDMIEYLYTKYDNLHNSIYKISALNGENVEELFHSVAVHLINRQEMGQ